MAIAPKLVKSQEDLPPIPARRYFTIGEASELCGVEPHVLRYWEEDFPRYSLPGAKETLLPTRRYSFHSTYSASFVRGRLYH